VRQTAEHTFIVRIWHESGESGNAVWRASVTNAATHERHYFTNPDDLAAFLSSQRATRNS
jgi:hypothetical protein